MFRLLKNISDLNQLKIIAEKLSHKAKLGDLFLLQGELGAGKTTFARFFIQSIFKKYLLKKPNSIKSPSFPIMINYSLDNFEVLHYDLYRLNNVKELVELNIFENIKDNVIIIEWPEIFIKNFQLENYFLIKLKINSSDKREIEINHTRIKNFENEI